MSAVTNSVVNQSQQTDLTDFQKEVVNKITNTIKGVICKVITVLMYAKSSNSNKEDFEKLNIKPYQDKFKDLDERTNKFFQKMMTNVNISVDSAIINPQFAPIFESLTTTYVNLRKSFLESMAIDPVKTLITDFDQVKTSIVDGINNSENTNSS